MLVESRFADNGPREVGEAFSEDECIDLVLQGRFGQRRGDKLRSSNREKQHRATDREMVLREQLQTSYNEQEILVQQQRTLLAELDQLYQELAQAALTDAVTGLPNHRAVMSRLDEVVTHCQHTCGSCAVLFVDLDRFKRVNDTWGHQAGDGLLYEVAQRLRTALHPEDFVGRYGGEEFVILLTQMNRQKAYQTAESLYSVLVSHPWFWQPDDASSAVPIFISASIGVAIYSLHGMSAEALLKFADRAMYRAKSTGCRVCLADREMASPREMPSLETSSQHTPEVVTAQALSAVISVHDRETALHEQRVAQLAEATARKLKRPEEEIHLVRLAALLHDIGKIGIPDAILHKADPLTEEEWIIVRRHPEIGRQILAQIGGVFGRLANSVGVHHERWDGRGYPNNRAGATIPLSARILAVVDSYDAMISPRPYRRELLTGVEAKTELQRGAGSQFDPHVVETFLCLLHEQENLHGPLEDRSAPGTSDQPHRTIDATTGKGQRQVETWRQQMEAWRQQIEAWQRQIEAWRQQQLVWQQRREALQQHQQHLAWRKQELERQLNQEYK